MRILLNVLFAALLLVLAVTVGTEVVALYRGPRPELPAPTSSPVVVRKASGPIPLKTVRRCRVARNVARTL